MSNFPWGEEAHWPLGNVQPQEIPVVEFCHDTHRAKLDQIKQSNGDYELEPQIKFGKHGYMKNGQCLGTSYTPDDNGNDPTDDTHYNMIKKNQEVLPGYYSWWSIHKTDVNEPTSRYGSRRISITCRDLLYSYQGGFNDDGHYPRLQFKNGGTLRYKHEICYVVIVCAEGHFNGVDNDYPVIGAFNIDYEANGRIRTMEEWGVPIRNHITYAQGVSYSWDNFVFAIHYPDNEGRLNLPQEQVTVHENIDHEFCLKREWKDGNLVCPDQNQN